MKPSKSETWTLDLGLPVLVLASQSSYGVPRDPEQWTEISHQGGGYACAQFKRDCIVLPIREEMLPRIRELTEKWLDSCVGGLGNPALRDVNEYSADLQKLDLTCETCYSNLMEGVYPFDATVESLRRVTSAAIPDSLDDLLVFESEFTRMFGIVNRWEAYILGENCD